MYKSICTGGSPSNPHVRHPGCRRRRRARGSLRRLSSSQGVRPRRGAHQASGRQTTNDRDYTPIHTCTTMCPTDRRHTAARGFQATTSERVVVTQVRLVRIDRAAFRDVSTACHGEHVAMTIAAIARFRRPALVRRRRAGDREFIRSARTDTHAVGRFGRDGALRRLRSSV